MSTGELKEFTDQEHVDIHWNGEVIHVFPNSDIGDIIKQLPTPRQNEKKEKGNA